MKKENILSKFTPDYDECSSRIDEIIAFIKNPEKFITSIRENPDLIYSDKVIKHVIFVYKGVCKLGTTEEIEEAKSTLIGAGLKAFIPQETRKRRSSVQYFRWFKQNPEMFIWSVEYQKTLIRPYIKPTYRETATRTAIGAKNDDILLAFENIIGFRPTSEEAYILTQGERSNDLTHISLSFICFNSGDPTDSLPFESLKDLYYEIIKDYSSEQIKDILRQVPILMDGSIGYFEYMMIRYR